MAEGQPELQSCLRHSLAHSIVSLCDGNGRLYTFSSIKGHSIPQTLDSCRHTPDIHIAFPDIQKSPIHTIPQRHIECIMMDTSGAG